MRVYTVFLLFCVLATFSFCSTKRIESEHIREQPIPERQWVDFKGVTKIPLRQDGIDVGYAFAVTDQGDIWAIGGWTAPVGIAYKWDRKFNKWIAVKVKDLITSSQSAIDFRDSNNGFIVNVYGIFKTTNGGEDWSKIVLNPKSQITRVEAVNFMDPEIGFVAGTTGYLNRSTFEPVHGIEILCARKGETRIFPCYRSKAFQTVQSIIKIDQSTTVVLVDGSHLLINSSEQNGWEAETLPMKKTMSISADAAHRIWILGEDGTIYSSDDLGKSWNQVTISNNGVHSEHWSSIAFTKTGNGIAVAHGGTIAISMQDSSWKLFKPAVFNNEDLYSVQIRGNWLAIQGDENIYFLPAN